MARNNEQQNQHLDAQEFLREVGYEAERAYDKFPSSDMVCLALMEEVGELAQAVMERERTLRSFDARDYKWTRAHIRKEAIQVAAMAMRIAVEGDPRYPTSHITDD